MTPQVNSSFLPFSRPSITEMEVLAVANVLRSGWITTGTRDAELEQQFCEMTGCRHAVALSSVTAGRNASGSDNLQIQTVSWP